MNKQVLISLSIILVGGLSLGGLVYFQNKKEVPLMCPLDVMMCPDGTSVSRSGASCEFGICKEQPQLEEKVVVATYSESLIENKQDTEDKKSSSSLSLEPKNQPKKPTVFSKIKTDITETITSLFQSGGVSTQKNQEVTSEASKNLAQNNQTPSQPQTQPTTSLNEARLSVVNNTIVNQSGETLATIPAATSNGSGGSTWETHVVNAIEVGPTPPIVNGVPVIGATGKYYISENAFGSIENCEFSNRVYIFDVTDNSKVLLFEENSSTLSKDDPRACNSEIFLLATEEEKLIIKYHTINTNMICESTWSEPDKTWYLDVTHLTDAMKRYYISNDRYAYAEAEEVTCRATLVGQN